jgi:hypothetical protein
MFYVEEALWVRVRGVSSVSSCFSRVLSSEASETKELLNLLPVSVNVCGSALTKCGAL